jgi:hypothetical protein
MKKVYVVCVACYYTDGRCPERVFSTVVGYEKWLRAAGFKHNRKEQLWLREETRELAQVFPLPFE